MSPPRYLIRVQSLLQIFGYFLLVLIGVELVETLKAYLKKDVIHVRVVLEVALIAVARKVIVEEPNEVSSLTLFGIAALILALGVTSYFERLSKRDPTRTVEAGALTCDPKTLPPCLTTGELCGNRRKERGSRSRCRWIDGCR